jgi:S-adenosylmethionine:tRNA ribosyltransferase-isomerase
MKTQDFDFRLPQELIAQFPTEARSASRMLALDGRNGAVHDRMFSDLPNFVQPHDVVIFNDTRVIKARVFGTKDTGGQVEMLLERVLDQKHALAQIRASHAPKPDTHILIAPDGVFTVLERVGEMYKVRLENEMPLLAWLDKYGSLPLPPYITRQANPVDEARYQTIYASKPGAVAAPTAGLHFDEAMLSELRARGVSIAYVTLHVGAGTFQPVRVENVREHRMHSEWYHVPQETVDAIALAKSQGGRVLAVGTTSLRALESAAGSSALQAGYGETNLFILPGYQFQVVQRLLTNFHLPKSTLFMLVCAFGGMVNMKLAYRHAVDERYRFFSYGDAMLIEREHP